MLTCENGISELNIFINDVIMCVMIHVIVNNIHSQFQLYDADALYKIRHVTVHSIGVTHIVSITGCQFASLIRVHAVFLTGVRSAFKSRTFRV